MNGIRWMGRGIIIALELVALLLAVVAVIGDSLLFYVSYSSPLGGYTGQEDDQVAALRLLWLVVPGILLVTLLVVLEIRRARRRRRSR
ncbi:hypothetical protein ACWD5Q_28080 [Streptomyces sp. NPDC002513]